MTKLRKNRGVRIMKVITYSGKGLLNWVIVRSWLLRVGVIYEIIQ